MACALCGLVRMVASVGRERKRLLPRELVGEFYGDRYKVCCYRTTYGRHLAKEATQVMNDDAETTLEMCGRSKSNSVASGIPTEADPETSPPIFFLLAYPTSTSQAAHPRAAVKNARGDINVFKWSRSGEFIREEKSENKPQGVEDSPDFTRGLAPSLSELKESPVDSPDRSRGITSSRSEFKQSSREFTYEREEGDCFQNLRDDLERSFGPLDSCAEPNEHSVSSGVASIGSSTLSLDSIGNVDLNMDGAQKKHTSPAPSLSSVDGRDNEVARPPACRFSREFRNKSREVLASSNERYLSGCEYCNSESEVFLQSKITGNLSTQTDCTCACAGYSGKGPESGKLLVITDDDRRESGYSSLSSQSRSPRSLDSTCCDFDSKASQACCSTAAKIHHVDVRKEEFLARIKKTMYDRHKEEMLQAVKRGWPSRGTSDHATVSWTPLRVNQQRKPLKGVLKNMNCERSEISEENISNCTGRNHFVSDEKRSRSLERAPPFASVIEKARQCLDHNKIPRNLKSDSKHRSRSSLSRRELGSENSRSFSAAANGPCFPPLHRAAAEGDLYTAVRILKRSPGLIEGKDDHGWPALHHALQNGHLRTACFLIEAGSNVTEYTKKRVNEYRGILRLLENTRSRKNVSDV